MMRSIRKNRSRADSPLARVALGILAIAIILFAYYQGKIYTGPAIAVYPPAVGVEGSTFQLYAGLDTLRATNVVVSGVSHHAVVPRDCAAKCETTPTCTWFQYCSSTDRCLPRSANGECWLMAGNTDSLPRLRFKESGWLNGIAISTKQQTGKVKAKTAQAEADPQPQTGTTEATGAHATEVKQASPAATSKSTTAANATAKPDETAAGSSAGGTAAAVEATGKQGATPAAASGKPEDTAAAAADRAKEAEVTAVAKRAASEPSDTAAATEAQPEATATNATTDAAAAAATGAAAGVRPGGVPGSTATQAQPGAAEAGGAIANQSIVMPEYEALRNNATLPLVFLDIAIKGAHLGRMEIVLFSDVSPRHAENMRQLCSGEKGAVAKPRKHGHPVYHLKGGTFYRIVKGWINQGGVEVESVFGGTFADDPGGLALQHDHRGLLSSANMGPNTNEGHFSIMMGPSPHLNGGYTIFGQVVAGWEVNEAINAVSVGQPENTAHAEAGVVIVDAGQLRKGSIVPDLRLGLPANATGYNV